MARAVSSQVPRERDVTLTVFMEGTSNPMGHITTQIALFSRFCNATPLSATVAEDASLPALVPGHYKLSFDGCGVSNGFMGVVFAYGLDEQCGVVRRYVECFLAAGLAVTLNFVGLSRGGIGGLYLADRLSDLDVAKVVLNLLLFDPVPGNLVWCARLDFAGLLNANKAMDISHVRNLAQVLVLYPYEKLPDIAFHAPLLPQFPEGCQVERDVVLGCHQGALFVRQRPECCLSFARIRDFLLEHGSQLKRSSSIASFVDLLNISDERLADMLDGDLTRSEPASRIAHSMPPGCLIRRYEAGQFLNRSHHLLVARLGRPSALGDTTLPPYMLDIEEPGASGGWVT